MPVLIMLIWSVPKNLAHPFLWPTYPPDVKRLGMKATTDFWRRVFAHTLDNLALNNKIPSVKKKTKGLLKTATTLCVLFFELINVLIDYICILDLTSYVYNIYCTQEITACMIHLNTCNNSIYWLERAVILSFPEIIL